MKSAFSSPGNSNIILGPSSRHLTRNSDASIVQSKIKVRLLENSICASYFSCCKKSVSKCRAHGESSDSEVENAK